MSFRIQEVEKALIGSLLMNGPLIENETMVNLDIVEFENTFCQFAWNAIFELTNKGKPINPVIVMNFNKLMDDQGSINFLTFLYELANSSMGGKEEQKYYAEMLLDEKSNKTKACNEINPTYKAPI